jgi:hypothetical protein
MRSDRGEMKSMPLELQPGQSVPIPCRPCGKSLLKFTLAEGTHALTCSRCRGQTVVRVERDAASGDLQVRTQAGPVQTAGT